MKTSLVRTVSADGGLAARALVATDLVLEASERHTTAPTASAALGRTLMGATLLAAGIEEDETLQVQGVGLAALTGVVLNLLLPDAPPAEVSEDL